MSFTMRCPYCFEELKDDEVLFRSERVNTGSCELIPPEYDGMAAYLVRHQHDASVVEQMREWDFFAEKDDPVYEGFWQKYHGTTEKSHTDDLLGVKAYRRQLIDPLNEYHQSYLVRQPGDSYFIRDDEGMVTSIRLKTGELCGRRVCRHCHNPLPERYGKTPVHFIPVIGITGAGKTVYLSQLMRNMQRYVAKVGLSASSLADSTTNFTQDNAIVARRALPGSTPSQRLQQPLFYSLERGGSGEEKSTHTIVLYDVAGEVLADPNLTRVYAPFIEHADGLVLLVDPMQFEGLRYGESDALDLDSPTKVLDTIHGIVAGSADKKCDVPCAVCVSKVDRVFEIDNASEQGVLDTKVREYLAREVPIVRGEDGLALQVLDMRDYREMAAKLRMWALDVSPELVQKLDSNYQTYSFFAFSALGCSVETKPDDNGVVIQYPVGPIDPIHVEEPLLWLFYRFGYISEAVGCPECGSFDVASLPAGSTVAEKVGFGRRQTIPVNKCCNACGHKWFDDSER